jgi:hypothetical protein
MPLQIVTDYPAPAGWLKRLLGVLVPAFGVLLIIAGLLASILPLLYVIVTIAELVTGKAVKPPEMAFVVSAAVMVVLLAVGLRLVRGKRRLVLFLRKFGFVGATQALTFAVVGALGRTWRLVTLDDAEVAPVGTQRRARWLSIVIGLVGLVIVAYALSWVFGDGLQNLLGDVTKDAMKGATTWRDALGRIFGAFVIAILVGAIAIVAILVPAGFAGAVAIFAWTSYGVILRAERSKTVPIASEEQLEQTAVAVARRSQRIIGPRLVVAKVASAIWQLAVRRLASVSSTVIIDITDPTDNLLWEIETLRPEMGSRWILVGEGDRLRRMTEAAARQSSPQARLLRLLEGEQVLAYSGDREELRRFARALHARLEALPST